MKILINNEDSMVIRLDKGDNFIEKMKEVVASEDLKGAHFTAIGACSRVVLSYFDLEKKEYLDREFNENFEILNLTGNIGHAGEEIVIHTHGVFGNANYSTVGGHVSEMIISVTCEIAITKLKEPLSRQVNHEFGLKLLT
jgi:uncharacterized protein